MGKIRYLGVRGFESFRPLVPDELARAIGEERLCNLYGALLTTRETRRMAASVLKRTMEKLASYPTLVAAEAVSIYLKRRYYTEGKAENYLIGIARGEAKRVRLARRHQANQRDVRPQARPQPRYQSDPAASDAWSAILRDLRASVDAHSFQTWLSPIVGLRVRGGCLTVGAPNATFAEWVCERYAQEALRAQGASAAGVRSLEVISPDGSAWRANAPQES